MDEVPPILVVEDEPLIRLTIVEALQDGGYRYSKPSGALVR